VATLLKKYLKAAGEKEKAFKILTAIKEKLYVNRSTTTIKQKKEL